MYAAIMSTDADGRVTKYQRFETQQAAQAFVAERTDGYPDAVVVDAPDVPMRDVVVRNGVAAVVPDPERIARKEAAKAREDARTAALAKLDQRGSGAPTREEFEALKDAVRALLT